MEYIDWDPALTRAATGCHIGLMEQNPSVTGFRLVIIKNENEFPGLTDFVCLFFPWSGELKSDNQLNKPSRFSCAAKSRLR